MYYELYIDVLFLVNFMMDYLLLLLERRILKCSATHGSVCVGALLGALLTCIAIGLPFPSIVKFIWFHIAVNTIMIRIGLKIKFGKTFFRAFLMLYISGFLLGGVFEFLHQYIRTGSLFFGLAVLSYYLVQGIWKVITWMQSRNRYFCQVDLYLGQTKRTVGAILDTGNHLMDDITGKPVCVLDKQEVSEMFSQKDIPGLRYVPYHSIGKQEGVLPVFYLDRMCIHQEPKYWVEKPLIGICESEISSEKEYKMILNPDIL